MISEKYNSFELNRLFLEKNGHKNPRTCVHIHAYVHACSSSACSCFMHAYTYTGMCAHARVPETMENEFENELKFGFGKNLTSSRSHSKPPFSDYKKPYMVPF